MNSQTISGLVSILMPVRNAQPFLKPCLESILSQTYTLWELVAINDHSTDHSLKVLEEYALKDPRIKVAQNKGKGIIEALRTAWSNCSGTYITRMDADDLMTKDKLTILRDNLSINGKGYLATGLVEYISENDLGEGYQSYTSWLNTLARSGTQWNEIYKECVIPSPCWMLHRSDLEKIGAFDSNVYPEDYDLAFRFYRGKLKCIPVNKVIHIWRDHPSRTSRTDPNYLDNRFISLKCSYFFEIDWTESKRLILWGAGKKGKEIAKYFIAEGIRFDWISNNVKKIGKDIYDIKIKDQEKIILVGAQIIIGIAGKVDQKAIDIKLLDHEIEDSATFFFC